MTTPREDAIAALLERFDSLIAYVETWGNAGDGFIDTLHEVRAALAASTTEGRGVSDQPRADAIAAVRSNWPDDYTPAEAKAWIAACDRIEFAIGAEAETYDDLAHPVPQVPQFQATAAGWGPPNRTPGHWVDLASPETAEALRTAYDEVTESMSPGEAGFFAAILAAMRETGR